MSAEALILEQLFEVIWHSNKIQLYQVTTHMNSRRMHVSEDEALIMHMADSLSQLAEDGHDLIEVEGSLAE